MSETEPNFMQSIFGKREMQEKKGKALVENVKTFQEIQRLGEEIIKNVQHIVDYNFPPILARLDQIEQLLVAIGMKVDISDLEKEVLGLLKAEVQKKK